LNRDWPKKMYDLALEVATWSKDPKRQVGAVIFRGKNNVVAVGYNGIPRALEDKTDRLEGDAKYQWIEHAERNAIYMASQSGINLDDCSMAATLFPCVECVRAILQCGIAHLITAKPDFSDHKWGEQYFISVEMLEEAGTKITYVEPNLV